MTRPVAGGEQVEAARLRRLTLVIAALFLAVVALHLILLRMPLEVRDAEWKLAVILSLISGGIVAVRSEPASRAGMAAIGTGMMMAFSSLGAALSMLALRWGLPQADTALLNFDSQLGIEVPAVISNVSHWPIVNIILSKFYWTSMPLLLMVVMLFGLSGQTTRMWRACAAYGGCLLTVCIVSGLVPAKGAFLFLDGATIARLPADSGTYAFTTFDLFVSGAVDRLSLAYLNGVACFPSFHTAAALILCQCGWSIRWLRAPLALWERW
jgi:hypothetical protein